MDRSRFSGEVPEKLFHSRSRTRSEKCRELLVVGSTLRCRSLAQIRQLATHAGQVGRMRQFDETEVRRFSLDGFEKRSRRSIEKFGDALEESGPHSE